MGHLQKEHRGSAQAAHTTAQERFHRQAPQGGCRGSRAPGPREVPARLARRHGGTRLGSVRFRLYLRRRLRGPPLLWHGDHHPRSRCTRLQGGHHLPARLEGPPERHRLRRAAPGISRLGRQHGLHGQPLLGDQAPPPHRRLHTGRGGRRAPQPRRHRLWQPHPPHVQERPHHPGRHRGLAQAPCALRLLARQAQTLRSARRRRRHPHLRHGRARGDRDRRRPRRRPPRGTDHLRERHRLPHELARGGLRLRAAPRLGRARGRPPRLRAEL